MNRYYNCYQDSDTPTKEVTVTLNRNLDEERKREIEAELKQIGEQLEALATELAANISLTAHRAKEDNEPFYCVSLLNGNKYAQAYSFSETWAVDGLLDKWEAKDEDSN